jgi:CheY-like chemotaxis protein
MAVTSPPLCPRILILDTQPGLIATLRFRLQNRGYAVRVTRSAAEALQFASRVRPVLAVIDFELSGSLSAVRVAEALRRDHGIPSVFYSGAITDGCEQAASAVGALCCLSKSNDVEQVADRITECAAERLAATSRPAVDPETLARSRRDYLVSCFALMIGQPPEAVRSNLTRYARDHNIRLDDLVNELQAMVEIDQRLQTEYRQKRWSAMPPTLRDLCRLSSAAANRVDPWRPSGIGRGDAPDARV